MNKIIQIACSLMFIATGCTRETENSSAAIPLPGQSRRPSTPPPDNTPYGDEFGPNDSYVDRGAYPGGSMVWIRRIDSYHIESSELLFDKDKNLIQASEDNLYHPFSREITNSTFTYDINLRRTSRSWEYSYDQNNMAREIRYADPYMKLIFSLSERKLDQYMVITRQEMGPGFETDTSTYKYIYNSAGDPAHIDCYFASSAGDSRVWSIEMEFTQDISFLNNDPMTHFTNLNLWTYGVPIVSSHLPASMKMVNSGIDFGMGDPDMTNALKFDYEFDASHRPVKINMKDIGGYNNPADKYYEITYVNLY